MDSHADLLAILALVVIGGKLAGQIGQRFGFPTAVGKITLGLFIGPAMLGMVHYDGSIVDLSQVGVVVLMFIAGVETDTETMKKVTLPAFAVAIGGVVLPFIGGLAIGIAFNLSTSESLFLGAILTATSVSISAQTLRELGRLRSREGTTILAAAVIDDVLGIIVLAFVFASTGSGDPFIAIAKMAIFLPVAFVLGQRVLAPLGSRWLPRLPQEAQLGVLLGVALGYSWAAEHLGGVAAVTGAYMAGLLLSQTDMAHKSMEGLNRVGYGFFVPIFFVAIGLQANFGSLGSAPLLVGALLLVAIVAKVAGCYVGARLARLSNEESAIIGVGMMSRGEVALVVAAAGLQAGIVEDKLFSAAIVMTLVTTILTPIALKLMYRAMPSRAHAHAEAREGAGAMPLPEGAPAFALE
jgi:Kef-type K+ transport system membrane component KefB